MKQWCDLLTPTTVSLPWHGNDHRIAWDAGRLTLQDHDVGAEHALTALGGERCVCLDLLDLWQHSERAWPVLRNSLFAWTPPVRSTTALQDARRKNEQRLRSFRRSRVDATGPTGSAGGRAIVRLAADRYGHELVRGYDKTLVQCLPKPLALRLALSAAVRRSRHYASIHAPSDRMLDLAALQAFVNPALARAARAVVANAACRIIPETEPVAVAGDAGPHGAPIVARLPMRWLADVWAPGLAVVEGRFVASVLDRPTVDDVTVRAASWAQAPGAGGPGLETLHMSRARSSTWTVVGQA